MNLYTEVLNALRIVNDPKEDSLCRMINHETLTKIKKLLDEELAEYPLISVDDEQT
tara:strand:+ start:1145 stop:1312 length:168 start_codon:yes stop_codon:yes gene_type:complete